MRFEEVQKVRDEVEAAKAKLTEIENAYLESQGYSAVLDFAKGEIRWRTPPYHTATNPQQSYTLGREDSIGNARCREFNERKLALKQVEALKDKHGLDNVFVGCGNGVEAKI